MKSLITKSIQFYKANRGICLLLIATAIALIITGIVFEQVWWRMLPLFVSLFVMLLQIKVSRYAFLLGAINCINYTIVYLALTLYSSAAYALLFSSPIQLVTFFNWRKRTESSETKLRRLKPLQIIVGLALSAAVWYVFMLFFGQFGSSYVVIDNICSVAGIASALLSLFCYIEFTAVQVLTSILTIILHCMVFVENPGQATYIVFNIYSAITGILSFISMRKVYRSQHTETA